MLLLTEEEKRTLVAEGYPIPGKLPLSKHEEKNLKKVRRKIKNKVSRRLLLVVYSVCVCVRSGIYWACSFLHGIAIQVTGMWAGVLELVSTLCINLETLPWCLTDMHY